MREPKRFADAALPGISHDGIAHFSRHTQPQPRMSKTILAAVDHQDIIRSVSARGIDPLKVSVLAEVM